MFVWGGFNAQGESYNAWYHFLILIIETRRSIDRWNERTMRAIGNVLLVEIDLIVVVAFDDDWRAMRGSIKAF